jgi:hypothetical protein
MEEVPSDFTTRLGVPRLPRQEALALSRSSNLSEKVRAGMALARFAGEQDVDAALGVLLLDESDTLVVSVTAVALLIRADMDALRAYLRALGTAEVGSDIEEELVFALYDDRVDRPWIRRMAREWSQDADSSVAEEAADLISLLSSIMGEKS